ncbi:MAG: hypothetical protein JRD93_00765 [Deltaproteobacteria bacterium]|nr:hypothetical protein [Deltaproteobacteria bacterium]MBW2660533.1 hypothetical protein [Deltaproteobacteria bacterium]
MLQKNSKKIFYIIVICAVIVVTAATGVLLLIKDGKDSVSKEMPPKVRLPVESQTVIDYNKLKKDKELQFLIQKRKTEFGVEKGVDIIARSDESVKIGDATIPMQELLDKIRLESGDIIERDISSRSKGHGNRIESFGIYVVQPGDNIWNIHFKFLTEYFNHKGITLSKFADEPDSEGFSSGVGKLLKFSEHTVYIYNIKEKKLGVNLNLIASLNKIIVYRMDRIFALLEQIDYKQVKEIRFDGETLWMPAEG